LDELSIAAKKTAFAIERFTEHGVATMVGAEMSW
jgi:hypothetical protein